MTESQEKLLWTHAGIAAATDGTILHPFNVSGISIDTRTLQKGDVFIALKGKKDGHHFLKNAFEKGASAAIISWRPRNTPKSSPLIFVKNTQRALEKLALAARARNRGKMVAITGSVGKTTVKEMTRSIFSEFGETHGAQASYNNHIGVPLTLARMPAETQFGVFEIGMDHAGEITPLSQMVRPHIAVITTVGPSHIGNFDSLEAIAHAKSEIFEGVQSGGTAIINRDNEFYDFLVARAQEKNLTIFSFGINPDAHCQIIKSDKAKEFHVLTLRIGEKEYDIKTHFMGAHNAMNIAATYSIFNCLGLDLERVGSIFETLTPIEGRGNIHHIALQENPEEKIMLIDESYNANPLSMSAALKNVRDVSVTGEGVKIAVLGQMGDLGSDSARYHAELAQDVKEGKFDHVYMVGSDMESLYDALGEDFPSIHALILDDIQEEILKEVKAGSVIFIKGSRSNHLEKLVDALKTLTISNDAV